MIVTGAVCTYQFGMWWTLVLVGGLLVTIYALR
ncbi:hypothetical protein ACVW0J_009990 [Bradyrhizobium sp. i1.7.7]